MMTETITRPCGHATVFSPKGDAYDGIRRNNLQTRKCHDCALAAGLAKNQADNAAQAAEQERIRALPKRKDAAKLLPDETVIVVRKHEGRWLGSLGTKDGEIEAEAGSLLGLLKRLPDKWFQKTIAAAVPEG